MTIRTRAFLADTVAMLLFFTASGILNERIIAGMDWPQVARARIVGALLMVPSARVYGLWRDRVMRHAGPTRAAQLVWDSLALLSFQVPIYAAIIALGGADARQVLRGTAGAAVLMLVLGRPYGVFLDMVRARFGLQPAGAGPAAGVAAD